MELQHFVVEIPQELATRKSDFYSEINAINTRAGSVGGLKGTRTINVWVEKVLVPQMVARIYKVIPKITRISAPDTTPPSS
jgi:hypothetical protein